MSLTFDTYLAGRKLRQSAWGKLVGRHLEANSLPQLDTWDAVRRFAFSYRGVRREEVRSTWSAFTRERQKLMRRSPQPAGTGGDLG